MANGGSDTPGPLHHARTRNGLAYFFYDKHHNPQAMHDAQWLPDLSADDEFEVFDLADQHELADDSGNLYGVRPRNSEDRVPILGTRKEHVAKFPFATDDTPWHGFPIWPILVRQNGDRLRPVPNSVLERMSDVGLITNKERRRLRGGKHI